MALLIYRYIDQGRNPQLYTKDCLEKALVKNEQIKGKIDSLKVMHFKFILYVVFNLIYFLEMSSDIFSND